MKSIFILIAILFPASAVLTQTAATFNPEIKRVAVFKNGYAFTYREGSTQTMDGWAYTTKTPRGVLGTVWGYSTNPNVNVQQLLASKSENGETSPVQNMADFLIANEGKQVRLYIPFGTNEKVESGTYRILKPDLTKLTSQQQRNPYNSSFSQHNLHNFTIALKTRNGTKVFAGNLIRTAEVVGEAKFTISKKSNVLGFRVKGVKNGQSINLGVAALEKGIRWIPAYRLEVKGNPIKEAKLELEANVVNELTDLTDSEMYFVVGVPHFLFQDMMSPLSMNTAFAGVSNYFPRSKNEKGSFSNVLMTQSYKSVGNRADDNIAPTIIDEERLSTFSAEQLFLYKADQISLKNGERTSLRLFSLTVPAKEVFQWTITDPKDVEKRYYNYSSGNTRNLAEELSSKVWYALRLKNKTGMPWTTAPALTFRDWKPIGQDLLTFTPIGGENILKVTPATEVIGDHKLKEKSRERVRLQYGGSTYNYDLITVEGAIKVRNIKKDKIELVLTRQLVGDVLDASDQGRIAKQGLKLQALNPNSIIKWNLVLPKGEKEIKYSYKIYVRR